MRKISIAFIILFLCSTFIIVNLFAQEPVARQIDVVKVMNEIKNPAPDPEFIIKLWIKPEKTTYKVDDEIVFYFNSTKDCYLTLIDVASSGKVHILFPNEHQKDNKVKAGQEYCVPVEGAKFVYKVAPPAGVDVVKAIATINYVAIVTPDKITPTTSFDQYNGDVEALKKDIELSVIIPPQPDPKKWTEIQKEIKIEEKEEVEKKEEKSETKEK